MREDPQVRQVENWLEARRQRGFYTEGDTRAADSADAASPSQQLVQVLASLDQRLRDVEQWPTQLEAVLGLLVLDREQKKLAKVQDSSATKPATK